jgi:hypothetical protein
MSTTDLVIANNINTENSNQIIRFLDTKNAKDLPQNFNLSQFNKKSGVFTNIKNAISIRLTTSSMRSHFGLYPVYSQLRLLRHKVIDYEIFGGHSIVWMLGYIKYKGIDPNMEVSILCRGNFKLIFQAIFEADVDLLAILILAGADVNSIGENGYSPLDMAYDDGMTFLYQTDPERYLKKLIIVNLLIDNGAKQAHSPPDGKKRYRSLFEKMSSDGYEKNTSSNFRTDTENSYKKIKSDLEILGLLPGALLVEIRNTYHKLALKFHPDKNKELGAPEKFTEINEAYQRLCNSCS